MEEYNMPKNRQIKIGHSVISRIVEKSFMTC